MCYSGPVRLWVYVVVAAALWWRLPRYRVPAIGLLLVLIAAGAG